MAPDSPRYAAFLSYSHQDQKWARWVHRRLEHYRVPKRLRSGAPDKAFPERLRPVFRDREELPSAGNLGEKIFAALEQSRALVVICSPASARSRWVNEEIINFKRLHGGQSIFCLVVAGEPGADDEQECFAPGLRFKLDSNGVLSDHPEEPIAADARPGKDGRSLALLKVIAGLLDVGLDDLRQREQQRRNRRVMGVALASLAGMALTGFLAVNAMIARDDAQRRQQQAEDLVDFMLGDLKEELGKVGRLDALDATARKAVAYFDGLPEKELDDDALARRAAAFRAIGEIHMDRREWDRALAINQLALADTELLRGRDPGNPQRLFDVSQSQFWVGYAHLQADRLTAAEGPFAAYLDLSEQLLRTEPDNPEWLMEVSYAHTNLAGLYRDLGRADAAVVSATQGVEFNRRAAAEAPEDMFFREELAGALAWLARAQLSAGNLRDAASNSTEARALYAAMLQAEPDNMLRREQLATSLRGEGVSLHLLGQHELARQRVGEALEHMGTLTQFDPSNGLWAAWAQSTAVDMLFIQLDGGLDWGTQWAHTGPQLERLAGTAYPDDPVMESMRLLAAILAPHVSVYGGEWRACAGCPSMLSALESLETLGSLHDENLDVVSSLARARLQLALTGSAETAPGILIERAMLEASAEQLTRALADQRNPQFLGLLARLHFLLGNREQAARLVARLDDMAYGEAAWRNECSALALCAAASE